MTEAQGRVGRWLRNKWHLDSLIAIGGMAAVYSSTHRNGARAAIKMLHSQYTRNEQARRRFLAEGYAANKVGHRNAVLVLDDDATEDGEVYLVMELLDGESLEGRLERLGVMGPMEVLAITDQLLEVLACAHPKGILHRDIKPANIYLTRDGAVKLLDFGLARVRELSAEAMDQSDGIVFGTVSYIAPEQARADNQNLDARSDMWSIAATMFRALSGETVHPSTGPVIDRLMAVARKPPRSIASVVPHLPRPVIELVDRALAFDPENRWPSANVMRVVVQDVMAQLREEAEAQGGDDEMTGMFARPPLGSGIASSHRTAAELPAVRSGRTAPVGEPQPRPKTDPVALTTRPKNLPDPGLGELELEVDLETAPRTEQKGRRSRTLLTKEGRAELRRILDARKGGDGKVDESTPGPVVGSSSAAESGVGDIDVEVEDSIIEVTIDHTHRGRSGAIAESLADNTTPAPVRADRATGSFAAVPEDKPSALPAPQMHASRATGGFTAVPEDRRPTPTTPPAQASRASAAPVAPDRRSASTASYPTLGGATSKPVQPPGRAAPAPARMTPRDEEITQVAHVPTSVSAEAAKSLAPISGEIGTRGPAEITRVGPPPAPARGGPSPRPPEPPRPESTLHDTLRPKTIPPVSARTSAVGRPTSAETPPAATPAPAKQDAKPQPQKSTAPVEVIPAPTKPVEVTPTPVKTDAKREAVKTEPVRVELTTEPAKVEPGPTAEVPKPTPRAGMFAAPPSRTATPVARNPAEALPPRVANPSEPVRAPAPAPGLTGLPSRVVSRPGASEPTRATTSVSPTRPTATPTPAVAAPAVTSPAPAVVAPAPAVAAPAVTSPAPAVAAPAPAVAAPAVTSPAPRISQDASPTPVPGVLPASPSRAPASQRTEPAQAVAVEPEPAAKDSAAARAAAPTASHAIVPAEEGPREPKLKAGSPVLPFSFLRPGPTTRSGDAPSEPPPGGVPPRKKP